MKWLCWLMLLLLLVSMPMVSMAQETMTVWIPYWKYQEAIDEVLSYKEQLRAVVAFGAIFDQDDQLLMLPDAIDTVSSLKETFKGDVPIYLSVINDVQTGEETYENKTTAILERLFVSEESIDQHVSDLIALAMAQGVDGIEIDYEAMKSNEALWAKYAVFLEKLYEKTTQNGLLLRSVLSWDTAKYASLPQGPEYTVMCYNLYGYHSGPGPKADFAFLQETYQLCLGLPGEVCMAYATGGFAWDEEGNITSLTQDEAEILTLLYGVTPTRDADSGALFFEYGQVGDVSTVWYADATTLQMWRDQALESGYAYFDLFSAGGNTVEDWQEMLFVTPSVEPTASPSSMPTNTPTPENTSTPQSDEIFTVVFPDANTQTVSPTATATTSESTTFSFSSVILPTE